jgi:hypothetical protein
MTEALGGTAVNLSPQTEADTLKGKEALARLVERAQQGDLDVLPELRRALDADATLWRDYGDLAAHAECSLIMLAAGKDLMLGESLQRKLAAMKKELGGEAPSPVERLLVERVTATWLQASYYDGLVAQSPGASDARLKALQRQQDAAHRRHLAALKTLATVRRLVTPPPSPLQMLRRPVDETAGPPAAAALRKRAGVAPDGVPVAN